MNLSYEVLLVLGIYGFYIYDSIFLVYSNQIVFTESLGKWKFSFPSYRYRLRNKFLFLPNIFTPYKAIFLQTWPSQEKQFSLSSNNKQKIFLKALLPFRVFSVSIAVLVLLALPFGIFFLAGTNQLLVILLSIYFLNLTLVTNLWLDRKNLNLTNKEIISIAIDVIACPPFAVNIVKKISLKMRPENSPINFANKHLSKKDIAVFNRLLLEKVNESLDANESNPAWCEKLHKFKERIGFRL